MSEIYSIKKSMHWYRKRWINKGYRTAPYDYKTYAAVIKLFFKWMKILLFEYGEKIVLPFRLGSIQIIGIKEKPKITKYGRAFGLVVDWKSTYEYWRENPDKQWKHYIYYTNEHSGGIRYKFFWSKKDIPYKRTYVRIFRLTDRNKKLIYHNVMNDKTPYEIRK